MINRSRLAVAALVAAAGAALMAVAATPAAASPAHTAAADCKTVTASMSRPDSAAGWSGNWATDTFNRTAKVCVASKNGAAWTYDVTVTDTGTFTTTGTKSFTGATMKTGVTGQFHGNLGDNVAYRAKVTTKAGWAGWTGHNPGNSFATTDWVKHLWTCETSVSGASYGWVYTLCNETLVNASAGNKGDVTGLAKNLGDCLKVVWTDQCDKLLITVENTAPNAEVKAFVVVDGKPDVKAIVKGGEKATLTVTGPSKDHKTVLGVAGERNPLIHQWTPKGCATATPTVTATTPGAPIPTTATGTSLPVTGPKTALIIGTGLVLLFGGAALVWVARRRRDRVTFEA